MGLEHSDLQQGTKVSGSRERSRVVNDVVAVLLLRASVRCAVEIKVLV